MTTAAHSAILFYGTAVLAVVLLGLSKGGFVGVGSLSLPLFSLVTPPVQAAAVLLPILLFQDGLSVGAFRKTWDAHVLKIMLPSAAAGILGGYVFASAVSVPAVLASVGIVSIAFGSYRLLTERYGFAGGGTVARDGFGIICGLVSGFTSQVALAGGPPFQMWVLPRKLPRDHLIGTTAIYFAVGNWLKVPTYLALGQLTGSTLRLSALLLPAATLATFAGLRLARRTADARFYRAVHLLMILVGMKLLWSAVQPGGS